MRALITGAAGQDGWFLTRDLLARGWEVTATSLSRSDFRADHPSGTSEVVELNVEDAGAVDRLFGTLRPDVVFHLAGLSSVGQSWANPAAYLSANIIGTCNILTAAFRSGEETGAPVAVVNAVSGEIFDSAAALPFTESTPLGPMNPYGVSKASAFMLARAMRARGVPASNAILFNHESHLRPPVFVTGKIVRGVARIKAGLADDIILGNLDAKRDWLHASDVTAALVAIAECPEPADFIVASGESRSVAEFVEAAFASVGIRDWRRYVRSDESLLRAADAAELRGDPSLLVETTGWKPQRQFEEWVGEMVALAPLDD